MIKKLRQNRKNKKGFTLVELIVVIVIILVLAAVTVPSVLRYITKANKANTKADAAAILVDLQAQVADKLSEKGTIQLDDTFTSAGQVVTVVGSITIKGDTTNATPSAECVIELDATNANYGDITDFAYADAQYNAIWNKGTWSGSCVDSAKEEK